MHLLNLNDALRRFATYMDDPATHHVWLECMCYRIEDRGYAKLHLTPAMKRAFRIAHLEHPWIVDIIMELSLESVTLERNAHSDKNDTSVYLHTENGQEYIIVSKRLPRPSESATSPDDFFDSLDF